MCGHESDVVMTPLTGRPGYRRATSASACREYPEEIGASRTRIPSGCTISDTFQAPGKRTTPGATSCARSPCSTASSSERRCRATNIAWVAESMANALSGTGTSKASAVMDRASSGNPLRVHWRCRGTRTPLGSNVHIEYSYRVTKSPQT